MWEPAISGLPEQDFKVDISDDDVGISVRNLTISILLVSQVQQSIKNGLNFLVYFLLVVLGTLGISVAIFTLLSFCLNNWMDIKPNQILVPGLFSTSWAFFTVDFLLKGEMLELALVVSYQMIEISKFPFSHSTGDLLVHYPVHSGYSEDSSAENVFICCSVVVQASTLYSKTANN